MKKYLTKNYLALLLLGMSMMAASNGLKMAHLTEGMLLNGAYYFIVVSAIVLNILGIVGAWSYKKSLQNKENVQ